MRNLLDDPWQRIQRSPTPRRRRRNAHSKPLFWLAWAVSSLMLWAIVVRVAPFPAPGAKQIDYAAALGLAPTSANGKAAASWLGFGTADAERGR